MVIKYWYIPLKNTSLMLTRKCARNGGVQSRLIQEESLTQALSIQELPYSHIMALYSTGFNMILHT